MSSNEQHSYSNPIYDLIDASDVSFNRPLLIDIEPTISLNPSIVTQQIPLLLLANCFTSPRPLANDHNYVNQRIEEENLPPIYARPRKRCVTLEDEPLIIPAKTSRCSIIRQSIKTERAQVINRTLPISSLESTDEIDQFVARENERVERVKLRRRQNQKGTSNVQQSLRPSPAFNNPNYVDVSILDQREKKSLAKSILV